MPCLIYHRTFSLPLWCCALETLIYLRHSRVLSLVNTNIASLLRAFFYTNRKNSAQRQIESKVPSPLFRIAVLQPYNSRTQVPENENDPRNTRVWGVKVTCASVVFPGAHGRSPELCNSRAFIGPRTKCVGKAVHSHIFYSSTPSCFPVSA